MTNTGNADSDSEERERFELDQIHLQLESERHLGSPDPGHEAEFWRTSLTALSERSDEALVLATAELWTIPGTVTNPLQTLIDTDTDLSRFQTVFTDGYIDPDLNVAGFGEGVIVVDVIETPPLFRGCGYGRLLLAESLNALRISNLIAAATPTLLSGVSAPSGQRVSRAQALRNAEMCGFYEWRQDVWVLDLTTGRIADPRQDCLRRIGPRAEQLDCQRVADV